MKNILITGHTGFIGTHLTEKLSKKYSIMGVSNNKSAKHRFIQIHSDIENLSNDQIPKNIHCIIHLAALTDVTFCENNPTKCFDINVKGTQKMLEISRKLGSKFIFASTSHVYGVPKKFPMDENHPRNPTSIYSASKLAAEIICESYSRSYGMNISIMRFFSVYGPNSPLHLVTSKIISQLLTKNSIQIGNLHPRRDFVYVEDVIKAIEVVLKKSQGFNVYNVGVGKTHSILEVCQILKKLSHKNAVIKSTKSNSRKHDIAKIVSDPSKLKKLGWTPKTNIDSGLNITYEWFKTQITKSSENSIIS